MNVKMDLREFNKERHREKLLTGFYNSILKGGDVEPEICKHFGCGTKLTRREKLFGNKCIKHSKL